MKQNQLTKETIEADQVGNSVLWKDIEKYENFSESSYYFHDAQRDALIAHARADAASSLFVSIKVLKIVSENKTRLNFVLILLIINLAVLFLIYQ